MNFKKIKDWWSRQTLNIKSGILAIAVFIAFLIFIIIYGVSRSIITDLLGVVGFFIFFYLLIRFIKFKQKKKNEARWWNNLKDWQRVGLKWFIIGTFLAIANNIFYGALIIIFFPINIFLSQIIFLMGWNCNEFCQLVIIANIEFVVVLPLIAIFISYLWKKRKR